MSAIQEIFRRYAPEYLQLYGDRMPFSHKKTIHAILNCRSGKFGTNIFTCDSCGHVHALPCSCGNRHCPTCQHAKATAWLERQMQKLLPCPYFMITFTVPEELRPFLRSHQRVGYAAILDAASGALKKLARDPRFLGVDQIGCFAVLQTWGRQIQFNPHAHFIVPAGGLSKDRKRWLSSKPDFFVHAKPLSRIYRGKFRDAMQRAGLLHQIDPAVWRKDWVIDSKAVGDGGPSLKYLSAYVFRVAISNSRIVSYDDHQVTFKYRKDNSSRWRKTSVTAIEFIRRFLQHVLPAGFMKIRHYGLLSANCSVSIQRVRELICLLYDVVKDILETVAVSKPPTLKCSKCDHPITWRMFLPSFIPTG